MKIGRNDPCPCGRGKKYKKCCLNRGAEEDVPNPVEKFMAEIREELEGRQFSSLAEAQAAMDVITRRKNNKPQDSFCGLSPDQMHRLLDFPFESEDLVTFSDNLSNLSDVPIMQIFSLLASALSGGGLKTTAKGNLPLKFCREAARAYWGKKKYYEEKFIRAFPMALQEGSDTPYRTAAEEVGRCFSLRTWERFAEFFGLAEIRRDQRDRLSLGYDVRIRPLLRELLTFHL